MRVRAWVVALGLGASGLAARDVGAQGGQPVSAPGSGVIEGTVYDSLLTKGPLSGATVYLVGSALVATTDSRGRFSIAGVPDGAHTLTFAHPKLEAAGIQAPQVLARVTGAKRAHVTIATPNGASLVKAICRGPRAERTGLLLGVVRDVDSNAPIANAQVVSRWFEMTFEAKGPHYATIEATANTDAAGVFRLCGVPADVPVFVRAVAAQQQSGRLEVYFNDSDVAFRDFAVSLTDSAARVVPDSLLQSSEDSTTIAPARGTAFVRGVVRDQNGRPLGNVRVGVLDHRGAVITDADGRFSLGGVPAGTQTIELHAIGFAPANRAVVLRSGALTETSLSLDRAAQALSAVRVRGRASASRYANTGFDTRRKRGLGWFMTEDEIEKMGGIQLGDVLRGAPGVIANYTSRGRTFSMRPVALGDRCTPNYYLDGMQWYPLDQDPIIELEKFIPLRDLHAVEVYRGSGGTPTEFDPNTGCGAIVFWTKR